MMTGKGKGTGRSGQSLVHNVFYFFGIEPYGLVASVRRLLILLHQILADVSVLIPADVGYEASLSGAFDPDYVI